MSSTILTTKYQHKLGVVICVISAVVFLWILNFNVAEAAVISRALFNTGLVGYWDFNTGRPDNTVFDMSGNALNATTTNMTNPPNWVDGKRGQGMQFDGVNDMIITKGSPRLILNSSETVSAWIKKTSNSGADYILHIPTVTAGAYQAAFRTNGTELLYTTGSGADGSLSTSGLGLTTGVWYHVAAVYNKATLEEFLYLNGQKVANKKENESSINSTNGTVIIGAFSGGSSSFDGVIDEVRIYNRALSSQEVFSLYQRTGSIFKNPSNLGLVGYWSFNEGTSTVSRTPFAEDYSGNGNRGTLTNMSLPPSSTSGWADGKFGRALNFDGSNDYVTIRDASMLKPDSTITMSAWVLFRASTLATILEKGNVNTAGYGLFITTNPKACFNIKVSPGTVSSGSSTTNLNVNQWYHVLATYDGTTRQLYLNGVKETIVSGTACTSNTGTGNIVHDTSALTFGMRTGATLPLNGIVDEVRIYNRALSAAEVAGLYKSGAIKHTNPSNLGLVGYWPFNEGTSTVSRTPFAEDYSGNNNRGTLTNMALPASATSGWADGKLGRALNFDGSNDQVNAGSATNIDNIVPITISAWIKPLTLGTNSAGRIVSKNTGANAASDFMMHSSSALQFNARPTRITSANSITLNVWQHVVVTWNGSNIAATDVKIYINGVEASYQTSTNGSGPPLDDSANNLLIGDTSGISRNFNGLIDDVRIYNRVLSADEVRRLYNSR